jgi:hypothetical protein
MSILQKRMTAPSVLKQVATSNRFSWFNSKSPASKKPALPEPADDEFLNLDITEALCPPGLCKDYSREAFKAFKENAESVLHQLHEAYRQRTFTLHQALAEKSHQQEELEETRTRVQHIKTQLDETAEKALEQDKAMKALADELEKERQARKRADEDLRRSVVSIKDSDHDSFTHVLETPRRYAKRGSSGTLTSDSGFDSGDESAAESIFSRREKYPRSPASFISPPDPQHEATQSSVITELSQITPKQPSPSPTPRLSTYDRVIKGLTPITSPLAGNINASWKYSNGRGMSGTETWNNNNIIVVLKEENKGLKTRIGELESAIDDCLLLVGP